MITELPAAPDELGGDARRRQTPGRTTLVLTWDCADHGLVAMSKGYRIDYGPTTTGFVWEVPGRWTPAVTATHLHGR